MAATKPKTTTPVLPPPLSDTGPLETSTRNIVEACCEILYELEKIQSFNQEDEREVAAMAGYVAKALLEKGAAFADTTGSRFLQEMAPPPSRVLYHYAAKVTAMIFDCLKAGEHPGAGNSKPVMQRFAEVLPKHKRIGAAVDEMAELSRADWNKMQASHKAEADERMGKEAVRKLHAQIRSGGRVPTNSNETSPIIEMQPPHSSMGDMPGVRGSAAANPEGELGAGNTVLGEIEVPRVS